MNFSKQFVNTLEDNIRDRGAMNRLVSESDQVEIRNKTKMTMTAFSKWIAS